MEESKKWFYKAALYSDAVILLVLGSTLTALFIKLRFKMDTTGIITLAIFLVLALIRLINDVQQ